MLKRITKITGLLVSVASIVSIIPAKAADVQKIEAQDGTIYSALAKGNGIFIDGEINGKDESAYYISADGTYHEIEGLDSGNVATDFLANKYVEIDEDTYVDVTDNYKVLDDTIRENLNDDAAIILRKKIKGDNDGRFNKDYYEGSNIIDAYVPLPGDWSHYKYKLKASRINGDDYSRIYSDPQGNYIDADYNLGSLKVNTTSDSVTIKNTEDTYEIKENGISYVLKAEIKENSYLNAGPDYIYRLVDFTIYGKQKGAPDTDYEPVTDQLKFGGSKYKAVNVNVDGSVTVLQKFSKAQASDDIEGIKYSKDSNLYFITDEEGKSEKVLAFPGQAVNKISGAASGGATKLTVAGQALTSVYADTKNKKIYAETVTLKAKNGYNYIDIGDYDETDMDSWNPAAGLPWVLSDGYVKTWDGNENFKKLYKVDGSMNRISSAGKDNIIVWSENDGVYSVIHNIAQAASTTNTTDVAVTADNLKATTGWVLNKDNTWNYILENGTKKTGWLNSNGTWYYLKADGAMATGWYNDNGTWCYLNVTGAMQTGWIKDNGNWYYLNASGAMLSDTTVDGYKLGLDGAWIG
jgi:glucan-binding YG repeat protein